jgi:hypothetical protein
MPDKKCPNCGLWNVETALICDCSYDFSTSLVKTKDPVINPRIRKWVWLIPFLGGVLSSIVYTWVGRLHRSQWDHCYSNTDPTTMGPVGDAIICSIPGFLAALIPVIVILVEKRQRLVWASFAIGIIIWLLPFCFIAFIALFGIRC